MNRRTFSLAVVSTLALAAMPAKAANWVEYDTGVIADALKAGKTVFVDYSATWCSTCKVQERKINQLRAENPAYDEAMTFVLVDWDQWRTEPVTTSRNIPRRSTLLVLKGNEELGRIVAGTSTTQIKDLMDLGL